MADTNIKIKLSADGTQVHDEIKLIDKELRELEKINVLGGTTSSDSSHSENSSSDSDRLARSRDRLNTLMYKEVGIARRELQEIHKRFPSVQSSIDRAASAIVAAIKAQASSQSTPPPASPTPPGTPPPSSNPNNNNNQSNRDNSTSDLDKLSGTISKGLMTAFGTVKSLYGQLSHMADMDRQRQMGARQTFGAVTSYNDYSELAKRATERGITLGYDWQEMFSASRANISRAGYHGRAEYERDNTALMRVSRAYELDPNSVSAASGEGVRSGWIKPGDQKKFANTLAASIKEHNMRGRENEELNVLQSINEHVASRTLNVTDQNMGSLMNIYNALTRINPNLRGQRGGDLALQGYDILNSGDEGLMTAAGLGTKYIGLHGYLELRRRMENEPDKVWGESFGEILKWTGGDIQRTKDDLTKKLIDSGMSYSKAATQVEAAQAAYEGRDQSTALSQEGQQEGEQTIDQKLETYQTSQLAVLQAGNIKMSEEMAEIGSHLNDIKKEILDIIMKLPEKAWIGAILAGTVAMTGIGTKIISGIAGLVSRFAASTILGAGAASAGAAAAGGGRLAQLLAGARVIGTRAGAVGLGVDAVLEGGQAFLSDDPDEAAKHKANLARLATGMATGATIGSVIPVIGTFGGAIIGGAGASIYNHFFADDDTSIVGTKAEAASLYPEGKESYSEDDVYLETKEKLKKMGLSDKDIEETMALFPNQAGSKSTTSSSTPTTSITKDEVTELDKKYNIQRGDTFKFHGEQYSIAEGFDKSKKAEKESQETLKRKTSEDNTKATKENTEAIQDFTKKMSSFQVPTAPVREETKGKTVDEKLKDISSTGTISGNNSPYRDTSKKSKPLSASYDMSGGAVDLNNVADRDVTKDSGVTAETLDKLFEGGMLEGMGKDFIEVGRKYGIDPMFLAAITKAEHNYGKDTSGILGAGTNNIFSFKDTSGNFKSYATKRDSLEDAAYQLMEYYVNGSRHGRTDVNTAVEIQPDYCPSGIEGGERWIKNVVGSYSDAAEIQGGLPGVSKPKPALTKSTSELLVDTDKPLSVPEINKPTSVLADIVSGKTPITSIPLSQPKTKSFVPKLVESDLPESDADADSDSDSDIESDSDIDNEPHTGLLEKELSDSSEKQSGTHASMPGFRNSELTVDKFTGTNKFNKWTKWARFIQLRDQATGEHFDNDKLEHVGKTVRNGYEDQETRYAIQAAIEDKQDNSKTTPKAKSADSFNVIMLSEKQKEQSILEEENKRKAAESVNNAHIEKFVKPVEVSKAYKYSEEMYKIPESLITQSPIERIEDTLDKVQNDSTELKTSTVPESQKTEQQKPTIPESQKIEQQKPTIPESQKIEQQKPKEISYNKKVTTPKKSQQYNVGDIFKMVSSGIALASKLGMKNDKLSGLGANLGKLSTASQIFGDVMSGGQGIGIEDRSDQKDSFGSLLGGLLGEGKGEKQNPLSLLLGGLLGGKSKGGGLLGGLVGGLFNEKGKIDVVGWWNRVTGKKKSEVPGKAEEENQTGIDSATKDESQPTITTTTDENGNLVETFNPPEEKSEKKQPKNYGERVWNTVEEADYGGWFNRAGNTVGDWWNRVTGKKKQSEVPGKDTAQFEDKGDSAEDTGKKSEDILDTKPSEEKKKKSDDILDTKSSDAKEKSEKKKSDDILDKKPSEEKKKKSLSISDFTLNAAMGKGWNPHEKLTGKEKSQVPGKDTAQFEDKGDSADDTKKDGGLDIGSILGMAGNGIDFLSKLGIIKDDKAKGIGGNLQKLGMAANILFGGRDYDKKGGGLLSGLLGNIFGGKKKSQVPGKDTAQFEDKGKGGGMFDLLLTDEGKFDPLNMINGWFGLRKPGSKKKQGDSDKLEKPDLVSGLFTPGAGAKMLDERNPGMSQGRDGKHEITGTVVVDVRGLENADAESQKRFVKSWEEIINQKYSTDFLGNSNRKVPSRF